LPTWVLHLWVRHVASDWQGNAKAAGCDVVVLAVGAAVVVGWG
jgi:hypothetical protein